MSAPPGGKRDIIALIVLLQETALLYSRCTDTSLQCPLCHMGTTSGQAPGELCLSPATSPTQMEPGAAVPPSQRTTDLGGRGLTCPPVIARCCFSRAMVLGVTT